jgi:hypothetical protein
MVLVLLASVYGATLIATGTDEEVLSIRVEEVEEVLSIKVEEVEVDASADEVSMAEEVDSARVVVSGTEDSDELLTVTVL